MGIEVKEVIDVIDGRHLPGRDAESSQSTKILGGGWGSMLIVFGL